MIHPTAIVERGAELGRDVRIGPYAVVGAGARVGAGAAIGAHALVEGRVSIGARARIGAFAAIGGRPQHRGSVMGEDTRVVLGEDVDVREYVTVHRGTMAGGGETRVGAGTLLMAYSHVAHDCTVGAGVTIANAVQLAGHVVVEDDATLGGLAAVHQFARVGRLAMLAAGAMASQDVPPFCLAAGDRARLVGLNRLGLVRAGVGAEARRVLRRAFGVLFLRGLRLDEARSLLGAECVPEVIALCDFVRQSRRGICRAR